MRQINAEGLALVEYYEGLYLKAYQDSVGCWTIGLGRIKHDDGAPVKEGDTCTKEQADAWLQTDLEKDGGHFVSAWVTKPLNENQYSALVSFTFNRGAGRFHDGDTKHHLKGILPFLNAGDFQGAADEMLLFDWAGNVDNHLLGLQRRRRSERALFLGQDWAQYKNWRPQ